jgi:hypothetical protein
MRGYGQFSGPGPGGQPVLTGDDVMINGKLVKDALGYRLYDTFRAVAGTAMPTNVFNFFQIPQGAQTGGFNFTTQYSKTLIDTNIGTNGQIPKGRFFQIHSVQCRVLMTGATDTTYGSSGIATQMPTNAAGAAAISAVNEEKEILEAGFLTFVVDDRSFEQGKLIHFPSPYGISGFAGGGIPGTSNTDAVAIANNGFGRPYRLPVIRNLDGLRQFRVDVQFAYAFTPNRNFNLEVCLEGLLYRPVL